MSQDAKRAAKGGEVPAPPYRGALDWTPTELKCADCGAAVGDALYSPTPDGHAYIHGGIHPHDCPVLQVGSDTKRH